MVLSTYSEKQSVLLSCKESSLAFLQIRMLLLHTLYVDNCLL